MDSYRPDPSPDQVHNNDRRRNDDTQAFSRPSDYDRRYDSARDYDRRRSRGDRYHDSTRQGDDYGSGYRDPDDMGRHGGTHRDWRSRIDYDEEDSSGRDDRDRFRPRENVRRRDYNFSDVLRREKALRNTGEKDVDDKDTPNRFLLIRDLRTSVNEALLAKGLEKLYRGADEDGRGAKPLSLRRVFIIKDRVTDDSMGYGFAEFHTVADAKAAFDRSKDSKNQCTVSSQIFKADFPHAGVFPAASVPSTRGPTEEKFTFIMPTTGRAHRYYDERYYASEEMINENPPKSPSPLTNTTAGSASNKPAGSKRSIEDATGIVQNKPKKAKKTAAGAPTLPIFQQWDKQNAEARASPPPAVSEPPALSSEQTYAVDTIEGKRCYLCNTRFSASEALLQHLRQSETHAAFLQDETKLRRARERLAKNQIAEDATLRLPVPPTPAPALEAGAFRDRAAERRQEEAAAPTKVKMSLKGTLSGARAAPSAASSSSPAPAAALSRGREMLARSGWAEEEDSGGRVIEQQVYAAGVGLGHAGSKQGDAIAEAERRTKMGAGGFLEATKEMARKRYEGMQ